MGKAGFGWAKESNAFTHFMLYHKHIDPKSVDKVWENKNETHSKIGQYRVVKQNCQVVSFHDFGHIRARMAQNFDITRKSNIFQLIQSKKLKVKAKTSPES